MQNNTQLTTMTRSNLFLLATLMTCLLISSKLNAQHLVLQEDWWQANGTVNVVVEDATNDLIYIAGDFTSVGPSDPYGAVVDIATSTTDITKPDPNGNVRCAVPDGNGGWFIGGLFSMVGDSMRNCLAQIDALGNVTSWNPNVNNVANTPSMRYVNINTLTISGGTLYVGGAFSSIGGQSRGNIAAIEATTGAINAFAPIVSGEVDAIAVSDGIVYVGGFFAGVDAQSRKHIAAIDSATGTLTSWNAYVDGGGVNAIAVSGDTVYIGGDFNRAGGQFHNSIAAIDATTAAAASWTPNLSNLNNVYGGSVDALVISAGTVYVGGDFDSIGGQARNSLAAFDAATGNVTSWDPEPIGGYNGFPSVSEIAISGDTVYVAGNFDSISGQSRTGIAALDATTGIPNSFAPLLNYGFASTAAVAGGSVYVGGGFQSIGGQYYSGIAALDANTGMATSWSPNVQPNSIDAIVVSGGTVYVGGDFTSIGGQSRANIAAIDATTAAVTSWNPGANNVVNTMIVSGNTIYVGGEFTSIGGQSRNYIAALDATTGNATSWDPGADDEVRSLSRSGSTIYAAGLFTSIGGQGRNKIAALDVSTGNATSWDPDLVGSAYVNTITVSGGTVYIGGSIGFIGGGSGASRQGLAAIDATTGVATSFDANVYGGIQGVKTIALSGGKVIAGGDYSYAGGQNREGIAALDATTGHATSWNPELYTSKVNSLVVSGSTVYIGGHFSTVWGQDRIGFAAFSEVVSTATDWSGAINNSWNIGANWADGVVPPAGADVTIPNGLSNYPILDVNPVVGDINIETGASLTILSDQSLMVDSVLNNNGTLTVESGGALLQGINSTLTGSGTFIVNRTTRGGTFFLSSPIDGQDVSGFGISPSGTDGGQIIPNIIDNCNPDSIDVASDYGNLLELRENPTVLNNCSQSLWFIKSAGNLTNGRGYSLDLGNASTTLGFNGTVNNGTVSYSGLTRQSGTILIQDSTTTSRGWHLVGNPYPSPIRFTGPQLIAMGFDAQVHIYDDSAGTVIVSSPLNPVTIAVGQGFQIRKTDVGGTADFTLDNSYRPSGNPTFYRQQDPMDQRLNITLNNDDTADETVIYFYDGATDEFDPLYDANKLMSNYYKPMLYTVGANERLSYNALPLMQPGEQRTVPIGIHAGIHGQFSLTFNDINTLNTEVKLEDLKLGTITIVNEGDTYTFSTTDGDDNRRFVIHFNKAEEIIETDTTSLTGIQTIDLSQIRLYPNPVQGNLMLELPAEHAYTNAMVMDITGKVISTTSLNTQTGYTIPSSTLANGIYYVKLVGAYGTTLKFIKQ